MTFQELRTKIAAAPELDFGDIFSQSIELFKKVWVQGLLHLIISMLAVGALLVVFYIPFMMGVFIMDSNGTLEGTSEMPVFFMILIILLYIVVIMVTAVFSLGLQAAFYRQVRIRDRNLETEAGWSWGMFFRKAYFKKTALLALAVTGISIAALLLCVLPLYYVMVPLQFVTIIYAFHKDFTVNEIITASFDLGNKKWLITFGLIIVSSFLAQIVGMMMCFVGIFVTVSFAYLPSYLVYKEVVGFSEDEDAIAQIGA